MCLIVPVVLNIANVRQTGIFFLCLTTLKALTIIVSILMGLVFAMGGYNRWLAGTNINYAVPECGAGASCVPLPGFSSLDFVDID
jgi:amino acid permease